MSTIKKSLIFFIFICIWVSASGMTAIQSPLIVTRPVVRVTKVVANTSVQFRAQNFRANAYVEVLIGAHGTHGVNGVLVGTFMTSRSGTLRTTVSIPSRFSGSTQLDLRVQIKGYTGVNRTDLYADVTFSNRSDSGRNRRSCSADLKVTNIVKGQSVTVGFTNLPPNLFFVVRMAAVENFLKKSYVVGSLSSGAGGSLTASFNIPPSLLGKRMILLSFIDESRDQYCTTIFGN